MTEHPKITKEQFFDFIREKKETEETCSAHTWHYLRYFDQYEQTGKKALGIGSL